MNRFINQLKLVFLVLFAVGCVGVWTYQLMYARPKGLCDARHGWWDWHERVCAQPMPVSFWTRRPDGGQLQKMGPGLTIPKGPSGLTPAKPGTAAPEAADLSTKP
jgi:hypothetical protein